MESLVLVAPDDERAFWAVSRDISPGGMLISSSQPLAVDKLFKLEVVPAKGQQELQVTARVVRSIDGGFACEFINQPRTFTSRFQRRNRATTRKFVAAMI